MSSRLIGLLPRVVALTALVGSSFQGNGLAEEKAKPKYGKLRLGPLYLTPGLSVVAGVDNNVYNSPVGVSDESVQVTPALQAVLPLTRHARLRGSGGIVPQYFHKEASQRHTDLFGRTTAELDLGPLTVFGGVGGGRYRQRFSLEIDERILRRERSHVLGGTLRIRERIKVSASETSVAFIFDPTADLEGHEVNASLDRDTITRRLDFTFPLTRKTSLAPWTDLVEDRFRHSALGQTPRVRSQRYALAFDFAELAFLSGRVAVGFRHFPAGEGVAPYDGLFLAINTSMPFVLGTRLSLSSTRDVNYSATPSPDPATRNTYVDSLHRAEIAFELPWKLHGRVFGAYGEARYLLPPSADTPTTRRLDHAWTEGGALLRRLGSHISLGGVAQHQRRVSPLSGHAYDEMLYGLTGEVHF